MSALSVGKLLDSIKTSLEGQFISVQVMGEVSNLSKSTAGHWYFTLSDDQASVSCALFRMDALRNPLIQNVKDGDKLVLHGPISVYKKRGTFQILARRIRPHGQGDLAAQFEKLKQKLMKAGLFNDEHKKPIPRYPQKIAVITAPRGAAFQDFLNILERRSHWFNITLVPAVVQGDDSPRSLRQALKNAQQLEGVDLIVLTRGGGSMEDLWSFNDEKLVEDVFNCKIPVISAVGHQVDFSLCDFVADQRCETPSAAAELISQPQVEINKNLHLLGQRIVSKVQREFFTASQRLSDYGPETLRSSVKDAFQSYEFSLQEYSPQVMNRSIERRLEVIKIKLNNSNLTKRFYELTRAHEYHMVLDDLLNRLKHAVELSLHRINSRLDTANKVLSSLDPKNVLERGYSYITNDAGQVIKNTIGFKKLPKSEKLQINFYDGSVKVQKES